MNRHPSRIDTRHVCVPFVSRESNRASSSPRRHAKEPFKHVPSFVTTRLASSVERTTMADATRHNDIVARLRMFAAAVMLLARLRAAAAAAAESPAAQRCPFAYPSYREAAHAHLAKVFDRAGFDTRRGSMWFAKGDDVPPDCETCGRVNPAIGAYGCPMLVRPRPFVATLPSRHDDAKADATRPGYPTRSPRSATGSALGSARGSARRPQRPPRSSRPPSSPTAPPPSATSRATRSGSEPRDATREPTDISRTCPSPQSRPRTPRRCP